MRKTGFSAALAGAGILVCLTSVFAFQKPFRQYKGVEYRSFTLPPDADQKGEFIFARLMFPPGPLDGYFPRFQGDWREGLSLWTQDYPRADRHFLEAVRRLTRLQVRSVEQPVNLDVDEEYELPFLYAVQVGEWGLTEDQGRRMREYLLRGGFFMADDFHGYAEYGEFDKRIHFVFPAAQLVEIPDEDQILHVVFDLKERIQIPGSEHVPQGCKNCENGGRGAHWQAIYDDKNRIVVAASYNSDVGDGWEWSDEPRYPENAASMAIRIGVNDIVYAMTH